jgi:type II secretory pathway predicted ATPase ExeA
VIEKLKSHYGFTRTPFGRSLAPQMLHRHATHAEAVARIGWCISERGLGVVTGEVGAGKTVAVRAALATLDSARHTVIYLGNPAVGGRGLYGCIVSALGGLPRFHKATLIPQTMDLLAAEEHERGRTTILVLDEAHLLDADQLEELRLLTNSEMDSHSPFACLLVGQPTLRRRIKLGTFAALDQRITLRYAMNGMTDTETADYVTHHLKLAGRSDTLFSDDALALIHQVSRGLPRAVNNLAIQALVAAYASNKAIVDESSARAAVAEVTAEDSVQEGRVTAGGTDGHPPRKLSTIGFAACSTAPTDAVILSPSSDAPFWFATSSTVVFSDVLAASSSAT